MAEDFDIVEKLSLEKRTELEFRLNCISPDDGKYGEEADLLIPYLSARAEWLACVHVQEVLLETRVEFGKAPQENLEELREALPKIDILNVSLLEKDRRINHDQLALIEEIGRYVSPETKALLHPGTTSYDILDTARSYLFRGAWHAVIRPEVARSIDKLAAIAEQSLEILQVGRTHLQNTSPILFGGVIAGYAARIAERTERCDETFKRLKGKISGIVGTGASIDMVMGEGTSMEFERKVLIKLGLKPDYTATQIVQKEPLADVGNSLTTMMHVLADFTNDIRMLYSSEIEEVTSRDNAERLGGSSADAMKNNPVQYENMTGKAVIVESGMRILYELIHSDFQRDLRGSVQARYQPQLMMVETYEAFRRLNKSLPQLSINEDKIAENLTRVRNNPSEAMVAILRGEQWIHPTYGVGHNFVKEMGRKAKKEKRGLLEVALEDDKFEKLFDSLSLDRKAILEGTLENYVGSVLERAQKNLKYARYVIGNYISINRNH